MKRIFDSKRSFPVRKPRQSVRRGDRRDVRRFRHTFTILGEICRFEHFESLSQDLLALRTKAFFQGARTCFEGWLKSQSVSARGRFFQLAQTSWSNALSKRRGYQPSGFRSGKIRRFPVAMNGDVRNREPARRFRLDPCRRALEFVRFAVIRMRGKERLSPHRVETFADFSRRTRKARAFHRRGLNRESLFSRHLRRLLKASPFESRSGLRGLEIRSGSQACRDSKISKRKSDF